ncbi:MAG: RIP metalloprotease RseP [Treponema sp.]|nr:RIP metalloprotease RseP [Treponema sp.]MCL2236989.1 RIP metalloprotease RseP [Treponema sp.]
MVFVNILLGLLGLGIVVFFHELGHFLAARLVKINVEAFSIGWGKPVLKKKIGNCEYRLGMFPLGGYCKMQGDSDYNNEAYQKLAQGIKPEEGSYHAASPGARILVCFAGPFFNLLFAFVLLSILWGMGMEIHTSENKIVLASEISGQLGPADYAGLQTGDHIIKVGKRNINYFHELRESIAVSADKLIHLTVDRNGQILELDIIPSLENNGRGVIGIYPWNKPIVGFVAQNSPASREGLREGDVFLTANGYELKNTIDMTKAMSEDLQSLVVEYSRGGETKTAVFSKDDFLNDDDKKGDIGLAWESLVYKTPRYSIPAAIAKGVQESYRTLAITITSLRLLFMGIDLTQAVSGPVRITYMMGEMATAGMEHGAGTAFRMVINFLAIISIALCVMNLLPLPILDGGMIILFLVEMIVKKPIPPKAVAVFQTCGMVIIFGLMILALFGDIMFFAAK